MSAYSVQISLAVVVSLMIIKIFTFLKRNAAVLVSDRLFFKIKCALILKKTPRGAVPLILVY